MPAQSIGEELLTPEAAQCADILGIRQEAEQVVSRRRAGAHGEELNGLRARVLRKILQGVLEVQVAESRLEMEMAYTYDVQQRTQRRINTVNQLFNIANFLQFGVLYTIEPFSRIHKQFIQSAICTTVGGGVGLTLPILNILYNKTAKASNLTPPDYFAHIVDGKPVDGTNLPPIVAAYLDSPSSGSSISRRAALNAEWNKRYHADMSKQETLCGIDDGKSKSLFVLQSRIVLLWSLYTKIQGLDDQLLILLDQVGGYHAEQDLLTAKADPAAVKSLGPDAEEAERLLHVEPLVDELRSGTANSERKTELELVLIENILAGYLDLRIGADTCQEQLNYQYDVVLAQLMARRGKFLQRTYEANFIQTNTLGTIAGYNYLRGHSRAGTECFAVANSVGTLITTVSLIATQGGWRKTDTGPNSLADFFNLRANEKHGFSNFVWNFLNDAGPDTDGKTRREYLVEIWKKNAVVNMDIDSKRNQEKLGGMPSCKSDTIKLVLNRIALLSALHEQFGHFDIELLALLHKAWPEPSVASSGSAAATASAPADMAAQLLGVQGLVADANSSVSDQHKKILITRSVLEGFLEASVDAETLDREIVVESQVMNRMIRQRDAAIQLTNILNFYQIGILGVTSNSLALSSHPEDVLASNRVNIVSGFLVSCLAITALLERHGGLRPGKPEPNLIGNVFELKSEHVNLSPLMIKYLDTPGPISGMTRRQDLIKYWQDAKVITVNVKKESMQEKLTAEGKAHNWWNETIYLINNRIFMLYDLRAMLRTSNYYFDQLLTAVN